MNKIDFKLEIDEHAVIIQPQNHQYTLIWIHGLNQTPQKHLGHILTPPLVDTLKNFRVVLPRAPLRFVTAQNEKMRSWFDIKFRSENSFTVDFDEAFSSKEVFESYNEILSSLIERQQNILGKPKRLFIGGFSQGCGMALHSLYSSKIQFGGVIGVSGYLFPITNFDKNNKTPKRIIYGDSDVLRPWDYVKVTYEGKIGNQQIVMVPGIGHQMKPGMLENIAKFIDQVINANQN